MKKKIYETLPVEIKTILLLSEGWLVGGAPKDLIEGKKPKDYDILVPNRELFQLTVAAMGLEPKVNTFGGLKFNSDYEIDLWCEELDHFIKTSTHIGYLYNLKRSKLIKNESDI